MVLFIILYKVVLTFKSADETLVCDHLSESEQYSLGALFKRFKPNTAENMICAIPFVLNNYDFLFLNHAYLNQYKKKISIFGFVSISALERLHVAN